MHSAGSTIGGKYALVQQIGEGGTATVWRAVHTMLNREVAVKFIEVLGPHADMLAARFLDEARIAAAVRHRNVVDIIDFGTTPEGHPYMVMELLKGESLADRLSREPALNLGEAITIVALGLSGLGAVHDKGIVHRDLKPENIFLVEDADGVFPKLLDFGISKSVEGQVQGNRASARTQEGTLLGTPHYMSPEQARGLKDVDKRTDIYSMGVILYEAICGKLPFDSENLGDLLMKVIQDEYVRVHVLRPEVGSYISGVVDRALARNRDERFGEAREMRHALLEAAGVTLEVSGLTTLLTGGSGMIRAKDLTPSVMISAPPTISTPTGMEVADTLVPHVPRKDASAPVPLVSSRPAAAIDRADPTLPADATQPSAPAPRTGQTPPRTTIGPTPNTWDSVPPPAPSRSKAPWLLAVLVVLLAAGTVAELRPQWLGLTQGPFGVLENGEGAIPLSGAPDAGAPDAGPVDAGVPVIVLRLLGVPADAMVALDDMMFVGETLTATRVDGAVVLYVPRRRGPFEVVVSAPGRESWRARRWALRDWEWTVELDMLDAGPPAFDAGWDAGYDAGHDAGYDAGHDAGHDAGYDAGPPDAGPSDAGIRSGRPERPTVTKIRRPPPTKVRRPRNRRRGRDR